MISAVRDGCLPSHPHFKILGNHLDELEIEMTTLSHQAAVRPDPPLYLALTKVVM